MFYTYVLKSQKGKKLYIGWTDNLRLRLQNHNKGKVKAIAREKQLKTDFGRSYLNRRI